MRKKIIPILVIAFITVAFSIVRFLQHVVIAGRDYNNSVYVSRVIDGDTIELSNGEIVRYIGIDAPELRIRNKRGWIYNPRPYAESAKDFNRKLVEGRSVRLEFDVQKRDKYNRLLAYVYPVKKVSIDKEALSNGAYEDDKMVNLEMVRQGYAMIYTFPPNVRYIEKFLDAQREAREKKRGLWSDLEGVISSAEADEYIGEIKTVEADVIDTYLSEEVLILNCKDKFKVVIFRNNLSYFSKIALRSPDTYFKYKTIRVYGVIKDYKGSPEIVLYHPSQLEILE